MTLFLQILGTAALVYLGSFVAAVVWIVLSGRRERRRAREVKAAAVQEPTLDELMRESDRTLRLMQEAERQKGLGVCRLN